MKCSVACPNAYHSTSPSMRREWIEIIFFILSLLFFRSPSMRREWIEILLQLRMGECDLSPSMRREWIEIALMQPEPL